MKWIKLSVVIFLFCILFVSAEVSFNFSKQVHSLYLGTPCKMLSQPSSVNGVVSGLINQHLSRLCLLDVCEMWLKCTCCVFLVEAVFCVCHLSLASLLPTVSAASDCVIYSFSVKKCKKYEICFPTFWPLLMSWIKPFILILVKWATF